MPPTASSLSPVATVDRRQFLRGGLLAGGGLAAASLGLKAPAAFGIIRGNRPVLTHGVQSGDVTARTGVVWARADRPSRMLVEVSRTSSFADSRLVAGPVLRAESDLTGKMALRGLPVGRDVFYRVQLADLDDPGLRGEPLEGVFRTAPRSRRDVRFVWSGDLAGQGWGINPEFGGYRIFRAMEALEPDFFLCSGDTIYADGPIEAAVTLPDGTVWRNETSPAKAKVAETLDEYRGQYAYNMQDDALRSFAASVPQINQWDDHEVTNNWFPGEVLGSVTSDARYTERRLDVLAARAKQAFFEWLPIEPQAAEAGRIYRRMSYGPSLDLFVVDMRTYKDPNDANVYADPQRGLLGTAQREWLKSELTASRATWKILAIDMPIGLVVPDGPAAQEGIAQGDPGAPLGRELEMAEVLRHAHAAGTTGIVVLTADVHYTAAHFYDPAQAAAGAGEFTPFWEFVSGPLNAGAFGPNALDATFGPRKVFEAAPPRANTSPAEGFQFFGEVEVDGASRELTVRLRDLDGAVLYAVTLEPDVAPSAPAP